MSRRSIIAIVCVVAIAGAAVVLIINLVISDPDEQKRAFVSFFDRPGTVKLTFETDGGSRHTEWIDYQNQRFKVVERKGGKLTLFELSDGKEKEHYTSEDKQLLKMVAIPSRQPPIMQAVSAAKKDDLVSDKDMLGEVTFRFKKIDPESEDAEPNKAFRLRVNPETGKPTQVAYALEGENKEVAVDIENAKRLPQSSADSVFNTKELKGVKLRKRSSKDTGAGSSLGTTRADLRKFKKFQPYWLGPKVDGAVFGGSATSYSNDVLVLGMHYIRLDGVKTIGIDEIQANSKYAFERWRYRPVDTKIFQINDFSAYVQDEGFTRMYIKGRSVFFRIDGETYAYNNTSERKYFIRLVEKYLQKP